ncbi:MULTISPECIES: hypothetical protein [unclassified Leucobacter]|uniref:hypothetical protein n=1 Tax=unclassified Leucobacter TaxID=2621730 RepID=UPI00165DB111|nr:MULTISPECIES: hypothetical protein [unclassified Leucobacter]MBC9936757.1 hypothetical protein [Leucobacter sp. cx-87]
MLALFERADEDDTLIEMLRGNLEAGADGQAVALVAERENGQVVGFVNTAAHDDADDGTDSHVDVDTLEIGLLLTAAGEEDTRPKLLSTLIPAATVREFERIYRRVPPTESELFGMPDWWLLPLEHGVAWNDVDDPSSVFVQLPNVDGQIAVHETGAGESSWAFQVPGDLRKLGRSILAARDAAERVI